MRMEAQGQVTAFFCSARMSCVACKRAAHIRRVAMAWWRRAASSAAIALSRTLPSRGARLAAAASASAGATAAAVCATTAASEDSARSRAPQLGFAAVALAEAEAAPVSGGVPPLGANFIADVADAVGPACVSITTAPGGAEGGTLFGLPLLASSGSGVIIDGAGGVVVTNAHVVGGARAAGHAVQGTASGPLRAAAQAQTSTREALLPRTA